MRMVPALALMRILLSLGNGGVLAGLVITRPKLKAGFGDSVLLECFFQSLVPGDWNVTKVDWIHVPENNTQAEEMVFYYYSNHSVPVGRFQHRVQWCGDVARKDGSVRMQDVQADDSGTYTCEIRVFGWSSVFKNYTVLHVTSARQRWSRFAGAQDSKSTSSSGWGAILGYVCAITFLALLLGYGLKKFLQRQRRTENGPLSRSRDGGSRDEAEEGIYSLIPCAETLKAGQEAELWSRKDMTYMTMHPSASFPGAGTALLENNVYVQLQRKKIPVEWLDEGRLGNGGAQESKKTCEKSNSPAEEFP
ncbi:junctional adhesion molecule-like [Dermochelys coriacea]|uniref:junctional adhesion molecule-like n=1 Tax=Dermochelys coriacea TaxID=27794 RepID=UPI0018E7A3EF|nr:junctional adhesion molecule-like [Dermochelys coriacea]XP_038236752.1 junctional adhesion molecule-like [Dermochelys coriacea]XP_038236753.1 junctional adhesion molecule-like [Dermochelys coriacea]